jgi:predicted DNA-binding protein with PD1-like motif
MEHVQFNNTIIVSLAPDEEIVESLTAFCGERNIRLATVSGIGAVNRLKVGLFDPLNKQYHASEFQRDFEITALAGTVTQMEGKPYPHLHITVADREHRAFGGHLNLAVVSAACEIVLTVLPGSVNRRFSEKIGLNMMAFDG